ncbi:fibrocystin-L-like [Amphibalanus amphitrite]|uniref:fibrocystin-L-like n=1 Tax=Amphibalanus amphitrite TaxID=1232801 RepID=UPI001C9278E3|nr:fibrocystin-L-like [Amphibalanus amphitrite]
MSYEVSAVRPSSVSSGGGAIVTVDGAGFDPEPGATAVTIGGAACRVLTATSTRLTCAAPPESDTAAQTQGGSGLLYELWLDAEVSDLGDLSALTPDSDGYHSEVLLGAAVTNNSFGQAAAEGSRFVGRLGGWLRAPHAGQYVLTLRSDGAGQLRTGPAPGELETTPVVETSGNFESVQKSALINMTDGQLTYFEATHKEGSSAGGYRLQVGLIDYQTPVTRDQTTAATTDSQTIYIKGDLRLEQQVLSFEGVPSAALSSVQLEYNGVLSQTPVDANTATNETWRTAVENMFAAQCAYAAMDQAWVRSYEEQSPPTGSETGTRQSEAVEPWCGSWVLYKPWNKLWRAGTDQEIRLPRHRWSLSVVCFHSSV